MARQARSQATQQALLQAAERLFAAQGYNAVSVEAICREAGVSKGAFYHHFPSKQAVFLALLERWLRRLEQRLREARRAHPQVAQALLAMSAQVRHIGQQGRQSWPLLLEFWSHAVREPSVWQAMAAPYRHFEELFAAWLAEAQQQGAFLHADPLTAARTLLALAMGVLLQGMLLPEAADWGTVAYQGVLALLRGWGVLPPASPRS